MTKPQCVLCNVVLSFKVIKPRKLKCHLNIKDVEKNPCFFEQNKLSIKQHKLNSKGYSNSKAKLLLRHHMREISNLTKST